MASAAKNNSGNVLAPLSMHAYAKHRGTTPQSVQRAIRSGRLKASLVLNERGHAKIADVALADREWAANTDLSRAPGYVKTRVSPGTAGPVVPVRHDQQGTGMLSLGEASALEKHWKAKQAELDYQRDSATLVNAKEVEGRIVDLFAIVRTKLLGVPAKMKARHPDLTHTVILAFDEVVREALEELSAFKVSDLHAGD